MNAFRGTQPPSGVTALYEREATPVDEASTCKLVRSVTRPGVNERWNRVNGASSSVRVGLVPTLLFRY